MSIRIVDKKPKTKKSKSKKAKSQSGEGIFDIFKKAPILSSIASLAPGPAGKIAGSVLASQGLGKKKRKKKSVSGEGFNFKKLASSALKSGVLSGVAPHVIKGKKGELVVDLLKSQGLGKKR